MTVKDDGAGIPPDKLDSIFDMFMQVDRTAERSQGGLGIGLTLVKRLAEMHGDRLRRRARAKDKAAHSSFACRFCSQPGEFRRATGMPRRQHRRSAEF